MTTTANYGTFAFAVEPASAVDRIAGLAVAATEPYTIEDGIFLLRDGRVIDARDKIEAGEPYPRAKVGTFTASDVPTFAAYLTKHGIDATEVWAHRKGANFVATIDAHGPAGSPPGWGRHVVTLRLVPDPDWAAWTAKDGVYMSQAEFAEFIEDHLPNFVAPAGADMLELAQTFQATTRVEFESSQRVNNGQTDLVYKETGTATAGRGGRVGIPDTFSIGVRVHEGGDPYKVAARFRYRITRDKELRLAYRLDRPHDVIRDAFDGVAANVEAATGREVWWA